MSDALMAPRWPGGPQVCVKENRLAFDEEKAASSYMSSHCPSYSIKKLWRCAACGLVHYMAAPGGDPRAELPKGWVPKIKVRPQASSTSTSEPDIPAPVRDKYAGPWCATCHAKAPGGKCSNNECASHAPKVAKAPAPSPAAPGKSGKVAWQKGDLW